MEYQEIPKELERMQKRTSRAEAELHQHLSNHVYDSRNLRYEISVDGCCYPVTYDEKTIVLSAMVNGGKERIEQLKILNMELQGMWEKLCTKAMK